MGFTSFNFHNLVKEAVKAAGYETPTPIQAEAIPHVLGGRDIMGLAQTGTGKTAAFVLPILNSLMAGERGRMQALIVAPTRELVEQINESIRLLGRRTGIKSMTVYGGVSFNQQVMNLKKRPEIVVACPGRLLDHVRQGTINLSRVSTLVLDEADQMFDMGFLPDIKQIIRALPSKRQSMLFSATMPAAIRELAGEILADPVTVQVSALAPASTVAHAIFPVGQSMKTKMLLELLTKTETDSVLVFTRTRSRAVNVADQLEKAGMKATSLQGDLSQAKRQAAMEGFRRGKYRVLVATDIAARGIDVSRVSHVINYDMPDTTDAYIHRIGRTGRAERKGNAFSLVTHEDVSMIRALERIIPSRMEQRLMEGFSSQPIPAPGNSPFPRFPARTKSAKPAYLPASSDRKKGGAAPSRGAKQNSYGAKRGTATQASRQHS